MTDTNQITTLTFEADELHLLWDDGKESHLAAIWLRDHCQMPASRNPVNGQRLINITDIPVDTTIRQASIKNDEVIIEFSPDNHQTCFTTRWLRDNCYNLNDSFDNRSECNKTLWQRNTFDDGLPETSYAEFTSSDASKRVALSAVADYGFVILHEVPTEPGTVLDVIGEFGYVRETNYGPLFEVRTEVNPSNLAFTNLGLGCHLDNPYRDPVPGVQLLHCLTSSTEGGESVLQDGFQAAALLREASPGHFRLLNEQWINFRFRDHNTDLHSRAPLIEVDALGHIVKLRFNNRSIDTIKLPAELIRPYYQAYRHFAEILERSELQVEFKMQTGDLILFDNTRVLHARKAYSASGKRHLQGAYSDLDGLFSKLSQLSNPSQAAVQS